jgi:hypothetical protein
MRNVQCAGKTDTSIAKCAIDEIKFCFLVLVCFRHMDSNELKTGDLVEIVDFDGRKLVRKAVEIAGDTVYICTLKEYELAAESGREPICVGFKREWVQPCHGSSSISFVSSE